MLNRKLSTAAFSVGIVALLAAVSTQAWTSPERTTYVKFNRSVSLPGVELTAGTYIFELADPAANNSLVRVMSRDRRKMYTQQFTLLVQRPASVTDNHGITFAEAAAGEAPPIKAWYPAGDSIGHEFIYRR